MTKCTDECVRLFKKLDITANCHGHVALVDHILLY